MKKWTALAVAGVLGLAVAGCGSSKGPVHTLEVRARNMAFEQKEFTVEQGVPVKLVLDNKDVVLHDWSIDNIPAKIGKKPKGDRHDMGGGTPDIHMSADASRTVSIEFTALEAGTYEFYCSAPGHKEAGMVGRLVVN